MNFDEISRGGVILGSLVCSCFPQHFAKCYGSHDLECIESCSLFRTNRTRMSRDRVQRVQCDRGYTVKPSPRTDDNCFDHLEAYSPSWTLHCCTSVTSLRSVSHLHFVPVPFIYIPHMHNHKTFPSIIREERLSKAKISHLPAFFVVVLKFYFEVSRDMRKSDSFISREIIETFVSHGYYAKGIHSTYVSFDSKFFKEQNIEQDSKITGYIYSSGSLNF